MSRSAAWDSPVTGKRADLAELVWRITENGVLAGMLGASVVAVWFFFLDLVTGRAPFSTPSLLGNILFAGRPPDQATDVSGAAVFAYTGLHGILFLIAGAALAWMFTQFERNPQVGMVLLLLFVTFEAILWGVGVSTIPALAGVVGTWAILLANLGSVAAMFLFLLRRHPHAMENLRAIWNE